MLFIDDEPSLVQLGQSMLAELGYEVTSCASATDALGIFRSNSRAFDLVITDQTMPSMSGEVLARELRSIRTDIPIILCSGYSHVMDADKAAMQGLDAFLLKPFTMHDLARTVDAALSPRTTHHD